MEIALVNVLFVCLGNICRSPSAEGVFSALAAREGLSGVIGVDSAGTAAYHAGEPPDRRAQEAALRRGVDLSRQCARKAASSDFAKFDYVMAMDRENHRNLQAICPAGQEHKLFMFLDFAPESGHSDVPDPYYGGGQGFEMVLNLIEEASAGLLRHIREKHGL